MNEGNLLVMNVQTAKSSLATGLARGGAALRRHQRQLIVVLLACLLGQLLTLTQTPFVVQYPDSATYLIPARHIITSLQFYDVIRPPGYPFFLAFVSLLTGGQPNVTLIVWVQAIFMVVSTGEIYLLGYRLTRSRWTAAITGALFGSNLAILQWERTILVGAYACFLTITIFVLLESYLRAPNIGKVLVIGLLMGGAVLTNPALIIFPPIVLGLMFIRIVRMRQPLQVWLGCGLAALLVFGMVEGYIQENGRATGLYALTDVTNVNLLGKILEYRMQNENSNPHFLALQQALDGYVQAHQSQSVIDPYGFLNVYTQFNVPYYNPIGDYGSAIVSHHPLEYLAKSLPDIQQTWLIDPYFYLPASNSNVVSQALFALSSIELWGYLPIPLLLIILAIWAYKRPQNVSIVLLLMLMAILTGNIVVAAAGSYGDFYRLRSPLDWIALFVGSMLVIELVRSLLTGYLTFMWTGQSQVSQAYSLQRQIALIRRKKVGPFMAFACIGVGVALFVIFTLITP